MLHIRLLEARGEDRARALHDLFGAEFLLARPLLQAITSERRAVLLIDEIDRADAEFEAFLLEVLGEYQITVPELGTIKAKHPPAVIITSNRTRELHDALKRRCLYHWIDYPSLDKEMQIVLTKVPEVPQTLAEQICRFVQRLRHMELYKVPGVAETLDWAAALAALEREGLSAADVAATVGCLLKNQEDVVEVLRSETLTQLLRQAETDGPCEY
jgi:MoxR-like ATPase